MTDEIPGERIESLLRRLYREFVEDVAEQEAAVEWPVPDPVSQRDRAPDAKPYPPPLSEAGSGSGAESAPGAALAPLGSVPAAEFLTDRYDAWADDATATRAVAAGVVVESLAGEPLAPSVGRVLVGLDLAVAALDDFVDTRTLSPDRRQRLAASVAFPALLSFVNVGGPGRDRAVAAATAYLVAAAQIPAVERCSFADRAPTDAATDRAVVRSVYAARARDITGFVTIPGAILDLDPDAVDRAVGDLVAYRARQLLIDDIEDVAVDRRDGIETPVSWLLATRESAAAVLRSVYDSFEYSDAPYCGDLRALERDEAPIDRLDDGTSDSGAGPAGA